MQMAMELMEMTPGAIPRPDGVPEQRFCPPKLVVDGGGAAELFVEIGFFFRVFASEGINRRRGGVGGVPRGPNHRLARQEVGPRRQVVWPPPGSSSSLLRTSCTRWKNRDVAFCFVQFRDSSQKYFSGTKNSRKQVLALRHLVNRLVPENA